MNPNTTPGGEKQPSAVRKLVGQVTAALRADEDMLQVLKAFASLKPGAIEKLTPAEARLQPTPADAVNKVLEQQGRSTDAQALVPGIRTEDCKVSGAAEELPATVYTPDGNGPFPVILYFHGGGWVIADRKVYDGGARGLAKAAQAVVVSIDYRQAPEHPFPAAHEDAIAAWRWVAQNVRQLNGDPNRLALAGESAGGNLAIATAIAARDQGLQHPQHVLAVYPVAQTGSTSTASYVENALAQPLNRAMMAWFVEHVLVSPEQKTDTRLNLVGAELAGLPPVTIINATLDPLRSDGEYLAEALKSAGVDVVRENYDGVTHEFFGMAAVVEKARQAQAFAGERLRQSFSRLN